MNRLSAGQRAHVLQLIWEGMSIRAITRLTGASKNTVIKLLKDAGQAFGAYQADAFHNLSGRRV